MGVRALTSHGLRRTKGARETGMVSETGGGLLAEGLTGSGLRDARNGGLDGLAPQKLRELSEDHVVWGISML